MRERLGREDGFSLVEMMVTMLIMLIVLFALYGIFDMSLRVFSFSNNKVEAVEQARVGLERMEREIRAAYPYDKGANPSNPLVLETMTGNEIAFGNDTSGDYVVGPTEKIRYKLLKDSTPTVCNLGDSECRVYRSAGSGVSWRRLVEFVPAPTTSPAYAGGLRFTYLNANDTVTAVEADVKVVRIELDVIVDQGSRDEGEQTLVTEVALRNRGG